GRVRPADPGRNGRGYNSVANILHRMIGETLAGARRIVAPGAAAGIRRLTPHSTSVSSCAPPGPRPRRPGRLSNQTPSQTEAPEPQHSGAMLNQGPKLLAEHSGTNECGTDQELSFDLLLDFGPASKKLRRPLTLCGRALHTVPKIVYNAFHSREVVFRTKPFR